MSVRVGRVPYARGRQCPLPSYPDHTNVVCLTASSPYGSLSPYELRDKDGRCLENLWQFAKIYSTVPAVSRKQSRRDGAVVWDHPAETHVMKGEILPAYWGWRKKGMDTVEAVRYPVTFDLDRRASCRGALWNPEPGADQSVPWVGASVAACLDYVQARKTIYVPIYEAAVREQVQFKDLVARLKAGENLLIIEVDGPHQESLQYYMDTYSVTSDFIEGGTVLATEGNLDILLNDTLHPYGHGYCLARCLIRETLVA